LINKLLTIDEKQRLGANGAAEIKKHPWFKGIDWNNIRKSRAPIVPAKKSILPTNQNSKVIGEIGLTQISTATEELPKMPNEEWNKILKHLRRGDDTGFENQRFDLLDENNQRKAMRVR